MAAEKERRFKFHSLITRLSIYFVIHRAGESISIVYREKKNSPIASISEIMLISMGNCVQNEKERSEYICRRSGRISARLSTGHLHGALKSHLARRCCCCCCCCRRPNTLTSSTTTPAEPSHRPTPGKCL